MTVARGVPKGALRATGRREAGNGHDGPVDVLYLAIDQRTTARLEHELHTLAPSACWTIERVAASRGLLASTVAG